MCQQSCSCLLFQTISPNSNKKAFKKKFTFTCLHFTNFEPPIARKQRRSKEVMRAYEFLVFIADQRKATMLLSRSNQVVQEYRSILGDPGADRGASDKVKTGGKNCSSNFVPARFDFVFRPTICPWVSWRGWNRSR